jgi:hypothetical protein
MDRKSRWVPVHADQQGEPGVVEFYGRLWKRRPLSQEEAKKKQEVDDLTTKIKGAAFEVAMAKFSGVGSGIPSHYAILEFATWSDDDGRMFVDAADSKLEGRVGYNLDPDAEWMFFTISDKRLGVPTVNEVYEWTQLSDGQKHKFKILAAENKKRYTRSRLTGWVAVLRL